MKSWFDGLNNKITASFKTGLFYMNGDSRLKDNSCSELVNMFPKMNGELTKLNFKTFRQLVVQLERANKNCKKKKVKTEIRIFLPIRGNL